MRGKYYIESPESERKYRRLAALGRELGVPVPQVFLEMEVTMPDGRVMHHHKQRSHSWVRNAYNMLFTELGEVNKNALGATFGAGQLNTKKTDATVLTDALPFAVNVNVSITSGGYAGYLAAAAVDTWGILVGYDVATVESFEDFVLKNPILEGVINDAHHLNYILSLAYVVAYNAPSKTMSAVFARFMNNNSGGAVTVGETGLVLAQSSGAGLHLMSRDHLGAAVVIPNTGQLKVTYTISLVFPA